MSHALIAVSFACDSNGNGFLLAAMSGDGINWTQFSWPQSGESNLRDPSLLYNPNDGYWYCCYSKQTSLNSLASTTFGIIKSAGPGQSWSSPTYVTPNLSGCAIVAAPHWFVDPSGNIHVIVGLSTSTSAGTETIYEMHPSSNSNLTSATWSNPVQMESTSGPYDPCVVYSGSTYYLFYSTGTMEYVTSSSLTSGYGSSTNPFSGDAEGQNIVQIGSTWYCYYDDDNNGSINFTDGSIAYATASSLSGTWTKQGRIVSPFPQNDGYFNIRGPKRLAIQLLDSSWVFGQISPIPNQRALYAPVFNTQGSLSGFTVQQSAQFGLMRLGQVRLGTVVPSAPGPIMPASAITQRAVYAPSISGGTQPFVFKPGVYAPLVAQ